MSTWSKYQALSPLEKFGTSMGIAGVLGGAYAAFAGARAEKLRTKSLALQLKHQEDMMRFNIRQNESQAQWLNAVYNKKMQIATLNQVIENQQLKHHLLHEEYRWEWEAQKMYLLVLKY